MTDARSNIGQSHPSPSSNLERLISGAIAANKRRTLGKLRFTFGEAIL